MLRIIGDISILGGQYLPDWQIFRVFKIQRKSAEILAGLRGSVLSGLSTTSQRKGIQEIFIEKDYWVTLILKTVFENEIGKETIFKGGTALSKCNRLIKRFSEDIDLVILRNREETGNQLKKKLKTISKCVEQVIPEIKIEGITNKKGMIRKTTHSYEKQFSGKFGQIRNFIVIESSWLGNYEPYEKRNGFINDIRNNERNRATKTH